MPMRGVAPQAVVLASDTASRLHPLNVDGVPKALLPVGNRPLLSYPLAMIEGSSVRHVLLVRPPRLKYPLTVLAILANKSPASDWNAVIMWKRPSHCPPLQSRSPDGIILQCRLDIRSRSAPRYTATVSLQLWYIVRGVLGASGLRCPHPAG